MVSIGEANFSLTHLGRLEFQMEDIGFKFPIRNNTGVWQRVETNLTMSSAVRPSSYFSGSELPKAKYRIVG